MAADTSKHRVNTIILDLFANGTGKVVIHAVRSLKLWSNGEDISTDFCCKKFHKMYEKHFTLLKDHKPLLSIFSS